jgi:hypothetical protein
MEPQFCDIRTSEFIKETFMIYLYEGDCYIYWLEF